MLTMREISIRRPDLLQKAIVSLATLAALAALGLVLAYWTWLWFLASHPEHPDLHSRLVPEWNGSISTARDLFGAAKHERNIVISAAAPPIKLFGVVAASGEHRGHAVIQVEANKVIAVLEGEDIVQGILLAEVHPDHIVLRYDGVDERVPLVTTGQPESSAMFTDGNPLPDTTVQ